MPLKPDQFAPLDPGIAQYLIDQLARVDGDHLLALPFMPEDKRAGALSILAFTAELREVPLRVTDPLLGAIRLEWWREALEEVFGNRPARRHPLVIALQTTLSSQPPLKPLLSEVIEGTALFLEAGEVTSPEEALRLFKVHDGARSGLLYHYLTMAQHGEERRHLFERVGALYGLSRAVLNLR
ncbi:MAG: squalene/phytoene synthase family protein, partial [Pseudomonadota bacterium]